MRLFQLAYGCRLYTSLGGNDVTLARLRSVARDIDPYDPKHRAELFRWLNSWGCRQFAKEHHATTASASLVTWADSWLSRLPSQDADLSLLPAPDLELCVLAYEDLRVAAASFRELPSGRVSRVSFGPTGAAKTLFALRPNVFPPWDAPIRAPYRGASAASFRAYLLDTARQLRALAEEAGKPVGQLPALVGRPASSPPKLIDEYNWVVVTKGCEPPTPEDLAQWAAWAAYVPPGTDNRPSSDHD